MKSTDFINESILNEVAMDPTSLQSMAANINAMAGMEFEMIVPNLSDDSDENEMEEDWDADARVRDFEDIYQFFYDGNHNSRATVKRLIEDLEEKHQEWVMEVYAERWNEEGRDFFNEYMDNKFDEEEAIETAKEEISSENPDLSTDSDEFREKVSNRVQYLKEEWLDDLWDSDGREKSRAYDDWFADQEQPDEEDYLLSQNIRYASDVVRETDRVAWPHWVSQSSSSDNDIGDIASSFSAALHRPYNYSTTYHGAKRDPNKYTIEPDGSLDADNSGDSGLEFISPPLPINELINDLKKVKKWAKRSGCYTNGSCGLHMNVSIPGFNIDKLDYVKLAILSGDIYVLNQFGRLGNVYAKSAMQEIKRRITDRPEDAAALLNIMKTRMDSLASKVIHSGNTQKYISINTKTNYVEFRSPGGDWLNEDLSKLTNTLLRFVVALDAACDPEKYRQEYLKKLYSILQPKSKNDTLDYFLQYKAGNLKLDDLKNFIKVAKFERDVKKGKYPPNQKFWWSVKWGNAIIEVLAASELEAKNKARVEWNLSTSQAKDNELVATPLRTGDNHTLFLVNPIDAPRKQIMVRASNIDDAYNMAKSMRPDIFGNLSRDEIEIKED
jgi:hypothetical protein